MDNNIYRDIAARTDGNIYIGVVGPVRTGKSTFISKFMQNIVIPRLDDTSESSEYRKKRAIDEIPQSSAGRTIMTTEPKFVPESAVNIELDGKVNLNVRLIDCVGYVIPSSVGYLEPGNVKSAAKNKKKKSTAKLDKTDIDISDELNTSSNPDENNSKVNQKSLSIQERLALSEFDNSDENLPPDSIESTSPSPRMVKSPWFEHEIPFNQAAEIGTQRVITEHSTIGLVITTDGSISGLPREEYEEAEKRVINELLSIDKPFLIILNVTDPLSKESLSLAESLSQKYNKPVLPLNILDFDENMLKNILSSLILQFPVREINFKIPKWLASLPQDHSLRNGIYFSIRENSKNISSVAQISSIPPIISQNDNVERSNVINIDLSSGSGFISVDLKNDLFYKILGETTGLDIRNESDLLPRVIELADIKRKYEKVAGALEEVAATGYGIVTPSADELTLSDPEIIKQGGQYGVKLSAKAPSIHMISADITTEVSPTVGSEKQSRDLIKYIFDEFEDNPEKIWDSNIFGKSLYSLVNEGLNNKLYRMPPEARSKLRQTLSQIINKGCNGLICVIL